MKVKVRKEEHLQLLKDSLDQAVRAYVNEQDGGAFPPEASGDVLSRLQEIADDVDVHFRASIEVVEGGPTTSGAELCEDEGSCKGTDRNDALSPQLPAVQPDAELAALQQEVEALAGRVARHRKDIPTLIGQQLKEHMLRLRPVPPGDPSDPPEAAVSRRGEAGTVSSGQEGTEERAGESGDSLAEIQIRIAESAGALPRLKQRLETAVAKMERVVSAVEAARKRGLRTLVEQVLAEHDEVNGFMSSDEEGPKLKKQKVEGQRADASNR